MPLVWEPEGQDAKDEGPDFLALKRRSKKNVKPIQGEKGGASKCQRAVGADVNT